MLMVFFIDDITNNARRNWSALFVFKTFFTLMLVFYLIADLRWRTKTMKLEELFQSDMIKPICLLIASITSLILLFLDKIWFSVPSSPPQFVFYLLLVVWTGPKFKTQLHLMISFINDREHGFNPRRGEKHQLVPM